MFVSYLILTLLHVQTAVLARPGGEVSQIKYLVRSCIFVSIIFPLLSTKRDQAGGFYGVQRVMLYFAFFRLALPFLIGRFLCFLKNLVISETFFWYSGHTRGLAWPWWQISGACTFLILLLPKKKKKCTCQIAVGTVTCWEYFSGIAYAS